MYLKEATFIFLTKYCVNVLTSQVHIKAQSLQLLFVALDILAKRGTLDSCPYAALQMGLYLRNTHTAKMETV